MPPQTSAPVYANYPSEKLTIGAGVAIFHLATARVVICYHTRDKYHFLPKGRKNALEPSTTAAMREGYEESGYRNRLLPLPMKHRQTDPEEGRVEFVTEAVWTQFLPLSATSQYLLFWYVAETLAEEDDGGNEDEENGEGGGERKAWQAAPEWPKGLTVRERVELDQRGKGEDGKEVWYEPRWYAGTGVDEEERLYKSFLLPIEEACRKLRGSVMEDVVRRGWEGVKRRMEREERRDET